MFLRPKRRQAHGQGQAASTDYNPVYRLDAGGLTLSHGRYSDFQHCVDPPAVKTEQVVLTLSNA